MRVDHMFKVIDLHGGGNGTRIIFSGLPHLKSHTMMEKMMEFKEKHDWIRKTMVLEPRGGRNLSSVVITESPNPDAHFGAFFMEEHGYLPMCGSDTISTITAMIETGQVPKTGPQTIVRMDTPAGLIEATAQIDGDKVTSVTFLSAPAFCSLSQVPLKLEKFGEVIIDVAYGGNFYCILDARQVGLTEFDNTNTKPAVELSQIVLKAVNEQYKVEHPELPEIKGVTHVQFFLPPLTEGGPTRDMVILATGNVDRSPCGTGTTAKVATLCSRDELRLNEPFSHQSPIGSVFTGTAVSQSPVGNLPGVRVAITGSAFILADSTLYVDNNDPFAQGYVLN